jgi:hypothetical protein
MAMIGTKMAKMVEALDGNPASVPISTRPWYERMWDERR